MSAKKCLPALLLFLMPSRPAVCANEVTIEVEAGAYDRQGTPVFWELPQALRAQKAFLLTQLDTNQPVDVQVEAGAPPRLVWIIRETLKAGQTRRYRLTAAAAKRPSPAAVTSEDDGKSLTIRIGKRNVLRYNEAVIPSWDPKQPQYARSGYLHPVYDPDGRPVTDDMAPDHAHQHGIMFPYEKVKFEERVLNFWEPSNGTVAHDRIESAVSGTVFGSFQASLRHDENDLPGGLRPVLRESWCVRVYNISGYFVFDLDSVQNTASSTPVLIEKNSYGGLAIRCHRNWFDPKNSEYLTSEGKTRENGNQTRPRWVDLYGWIDGKMSGVAIMDHPDNFRFPQPVRLHPAKPYFCFSPMAIDAFTMEPGKPYVSHYRFYIHTGKPDPRLIETLWHDYAEPPRVRLLTGT
jgi:methane monooxygenase PmoA-like